MAHKAIGYAAYTDAEGVWHPMRQERVELTPEEVNDRAVDERAYRIKAARRGRELVRVSALKVSARAKLQAIAGLTDEESEALS